MNAKKFRMQKFYYRGTNKGLIVPIDHGVTVGSLKGLRTLNEIKDWIGSEAITGIIAHKGMAEKLVENNMLLGKALMIHLNGMSTLSHKADTKIMLTTVEEAIQLGADAVSFQVNFDGENDTENLSQMGSVVRESSRFGIPVLAMIYDKKKETVENSNRIKHLVRIAFELGCNAVKIALPSDYHKTILEMSEMIPVFVAGGMFSNSEKLEELAQNVIKAGASGLCAGRNIFESSDRILLTNLKANILFPEGVRAVG